MKKITFLFIFVSLFTSLSAITQIKTNSVFAFPGDDSQKFFEEGNQEIENLEEEQSEQQTLEQKEKKLEPELEIRQEGPRIELEDSPEERLGLDDNEPFPSGHEQIRID